MHEHPDTVIESQGVWTLVSIQASAFGVAGLLFSRLLANLYGVGVAVTSICAGNLVLWLLAVGVLSLSQPSGKGRVRHIIDSVDHYIGRIGRWIAAVIVCVSFIIWFAIQTDEAVPVWLNLMGSDHEFSQINVIQLQVVFGALCTFVALGGIKAIRITCVILFPLQLVFLVYALVVSREPLPAIGHWGISLPAFVAAIGVNLPGIVNYPTFFRHSKSPSCSIVAISLIILIDTLIELAGIFIGGEPSPERASMRIAVAGPQTLYLILCAIFIPISTLCVNLTNVYFASVGMETIIPKVSGKLEYAIMGLLGTAVVLVIQFINWLDDFNSLATAGIASLSLVLVSVYLIEALTSVEYKKRWLLHLVALLAWMVGIVAAAFAQFDHPGEPMFAIKYAVAGTVIVLLACSFIAETTVGWVGVVKRST